MKLELDLRSVAPQIERTGSKEMLRVTRDGSRTTVRINSSSLSLIQTCARKSQYVLQRKLRTKTEAPATLFGSAIHKALEVFYSAERERRVLPKDFKKRSDMIPHEPSLGMHTELLLQACQMFCIHAEPLRGLPDTDKRSLASGIWLLQNYFDTYLSDPFVVLCDANGPITERTVETTIYDSAELTVILFGTIDVVLQNEQSGVILPTDHKTSSVVGTDFYNRLKPNHQYTGYLLLAQEVLGLQTDSFLVNCLQVKSRPLTARGSAPHFPRQVTRRSPDDMTEFKATLVNAVRDYLRWESEEFFPLGCVDNCTHYGGCQFLDVCGSPFALRENILSAKFNEGISDAT